MRFWVLAIGAVTFLAGLLFGYDQGVISGELKLVKDDLDIGTFASEIITSWVTLGALAGALMAGVLADRIGRRKVLVAAGVLFILGAVVEAVADSAAVLTVGRVITGVGVGFASTTAPLYAAEMAPQKWRGRMVSSYQLAITVGIFVAYDGCARRLHRVLCLLAWPGGVHDHLRDLPQPGPRPGRLPGHGGELGCGVPRDAVLPHRRPRDRRGGDVLRARADVRVRLHLRVALRAGDPRLLPRGDPGEWARDEPPGEWEDTAPAFKSHD